MPTAQPKSSTDCMKNLRLCRDQEPTLGPGPIRDILDLALITHCTFSRALMLRDASPSTAMICAWLLAAFSECGSACAGSAFCWTVASESIMSAIAQASLVSSPPITIPDRTLVTGLALTSFAALLLELALTRLFSVVLFYHFAFLAISIALLGLGAGGVFAYLFKTKLAGFSTRNLAACLCLGNALMVPAVLETVLHVPVALEVSSKNFLHLTALYLIAAVPFLFTGLLFSVVFARETERIPWLYGADLAGGSMACLAVVPLLNWWGGPNTILFAGVTQAIAAGVWGQNRTGRRVAGLFAVALLTLIVANHSGSFFFS